MNRTWHHGRPIRGFFGGLLLMHQFGLIVLEMPWIIVLPLLMALASAVRGWLGTPYH